MTDTSYLPLVGLALIAVSHVVSSGLATLWPWFATRPGKYVVSFGAAALLALGEAFRTGAGLSPGLLTVALAAGWTASGGYEMLRDLIAWWRDRSKPPSGGLTALLIAGAITTVTCTGCPSVIESRPVTAIVDCTKANRDKITALEVEMVAALSGAGWSGVKQRAIDAGLEIGGCALAEVIQSYLAQGKALAPTDTWQARNAFEEYRKNYAGGATFRTAEGDL